MNQYYTQYTELMQLFLAYRAERMVHGIYDGPAKEALLKHIEANLALYSAMLIDAPEWKGLIQ